MDDDLFDTVLVSFGSCGFIHGVLLEVVDQYTLHATRYYNPGSISDLYPALTQLDMSNVKPNWDTSNDAKKINPGGNKDFFHFEVYRNPQSSGNTEAVVLVMDKLQYSPNNFNHNPPSNLSINDDGTRIAELLKKIPVGGQAINNLIMEKVFTSVYSPYEAFGTIGDINPKLGQIAAGTIVLCIAFDMQHTLDVIDFSDNAKSKFPGTFFWSDIRFIPKAKGLLAFQKEDKNCCFEICGIGTPDLVGLINYFLAQLRESGLHTILFATGMCR